MFRFLAAAYLLAATAFAQAPVFEASRVQVPNSADTTPLAPGVLVSVYGTNLGPSQSCEGRADPNLRETPSPLRKDVGWNNVFVFPKELCGVRVLVGGEPAGLLYVHRDQINFKDPQTAPMEGTVGLQIVHRGQASEEVQIAAGLASLELSFEEPAFTEMPIWVQVKIPPDRGADIQYPYRWGPGDIGCNELLLRKNGELLERSVPAPLPSGIGSGPSCGSGSYGNGYENRLPVHLLYRIEEPGDYEVRLNMSHTDNWNRALTDDEIFIQSEWTPLHVEASTPQQRDAWFDTITRNPPVARPAIVGDYLPSLLAALNQRSLDVIVEHLYHLDESVSRYAQKALAYWPDEQALQTVRRAVERRGPSPAAVRWLYMMRAQGVDPLSVVNASLPYLASNDPTALHGAVNAVQSLGWLRETEMSSALRERTVDAMIAAERYALAAGDPRISHDYAQALDVARDERTAPVLWRLVDEGVSLGTTLQAIAHLAIEGDLPKLAAYIGVKGMPRDYYSHTDDLLGPLIASYGAEALPYVIGAIRDSESERLRDQAGRTLVYSDLPQAWAFIAAAIENDAPYKADVMRHIGARYPKENATEAAMLALAKRLAARPAP